MKNRRAVRVEIRMTENEYEDLRTAISEDGFQDVSKFIRHRILSRDSRFRYFKKVELRKMAFEMSCARNYLNRLRKNAEGRISMSREETLRTVDLIMEKLETAEKKIAALEPRKEEGREEDGHCEDAAP